jgi:hypothetical protein
MLRLRRHLSIRKPIERLKDDHEPADARIDILYRFQTIYKVRAFLHIFLALTDDTSWGLGYPETS